MNVGNGAFADVIKDLRMGSSHLGLSSQALNPMIRIPIREKADGNLGKDRRPCEDRCRGWNYVATNHKLLDPSETGRGQEGFSPKSLPWEFSPGDTWILDP